MGSIRHFTSRLWRAAGAAVAGIAAFAAAAQSDLSYPPATSSGHDFNHAPLGQSFTAIASDVRAGLYVADEGSFTDWLATVYPGQIAPGSYPYAIAPSVSVRIDLIQGEGAGPILHSATRTLTAPFAGFVDVDYGAAGVLLTVGEKYTLLLTDVSQQTYGSGVTGWVVPGVHDTSGTGQLVTGPDGGVVGYLPYGAYPDGLPVLQGVLVANDAGVGDNAFHVVENVPPAPETVSGTNAVITAFVARNPGFIVINGGLNLNDHLWTTDLNPGNTLFLGGLVNWFQTGLLVDYTGTATPQGVVLTHLTVKPAPAPLAAAANLPVGLAGSAYSGSVSISGGLTPVTVTVDGLPLGLGFDGAVVSGIPVADGTSPLVITVTDALGTSVVLTPNLVINAPTPAPVRYTIRDEGRSRITAVGSGYLMVGAKRIVWDAATSIKVETSSGTLRVISSEVKPGMRIEWKGLRNPKTNTVLASKMEIR